MELSDLLWADYGYWRSCTAHFKKVRKDRPYFTPLKFTDERRALMAQVVRWCGTRTVPPRQWLYSLFASRKWIVSPQLAAGTLCSERHLARFAEFSDYDFFLLRMKALDNLRALLDPATFDPNKDLSATAEQAKRYYRDAGLIQYCIDRMHDETFGYHPGSSVCMDCAGNKACALQLMRVCDFDILGLRLLHLSAEQAREQAFTRAAARGSERPFVRIP